MYQMIFRIAPIQKFFKILGVSAKNHLVQIIILVISVAVYYPFFKIQDNKAYENEQAQIESEA